VPNISRVVESKFHSVSPGAFEVQPISGGQESRSVGKILQPEKLKKLYRNAIESAVRRLPSSGGKGAVARAVG